jgi:hypothetical protein
MTLPVGAATRLEGLGFLPVYRNAVAKGEVLPGAVAADAAPGAGEPRGVSELRALRAGRHRWD